MATAAPSSSAAPATPPAAPPASPASPQEGVAALQVKHRGLLTLGIMLATIMQILDSTIANVALPHMQTALGATADTVTWVLTSYIVAVAIAIPITGWLSEQVGSRKLFLLSTLGFVIASAMCGAAQSLEQMIAFRILQGVCAAFMGPLSQTALLDINPPERQARAMSIWGMGIMVGPIMGPVIGGWLTDNLDWRWVFYVNLPLGAICIAILWWLLPTRESTKRRFDVFGFAMLALSIAGIQLMLDRGQGEDWFNSTEVWVEMLLAVIAGWIFVVHMITAKNPMFDRAMWRDRNLVTSIFFMIVIGLIMFGTTALLPQMLQGLYGHTVFETGLLMMPRGMGVILTTAIAGKLSQRGVDPRYTVSLGMAISAYSLWMMAQWSLEMGSTPVLVSGFLQGLGMGLVFMPMTAIAFATLPTRYRTEAASLSNLARNLGASVGISVVTVLLSRSIQTSHAALVPNITAQTLDTFDPGLLQMLGGSGDTVLAMLDAEINRQALMIGYLNDFYAMMIVTACAIPLVMLLKRPKGAIRIDPADAGH